MPKSSAERLVFTFEGETYDLSLDDYTATEAQQFRSATGTSLASVFVQQTVDLDTFAGLIWLIQRRKHPRVSYQMIADKVTWTKLELVEADETPAEEPSNPEV